MPEIVDRAFQLKSSTSAVRASATIAMMRAEQIG